jgi:hypothetical protein
MVNPGRLTNWYSNGDEQSVENTGFLRHHNENTYHTKVMVIYNEQVFRAFARKMGKQS